MVVSSLEGQCGHLAEVGEQTDAADGGVGRILPLVSL
jgi:hypothetical protein